MSEEQHWAAELDAAIKREFGVETETYFDLLGTMRYVTMPIDGKTPLTDEVHEYIRSWVKIHKSGDRNPTN